jgi:hypothetical protein
MAGGLRAPDYFPFESIATQALVPDVDADDSVNSGVFDWFRKFFRFISANKDYGREYDDDLKAIQRSRRSISTSELCPRIL